MIWDIMDTFQMHKLVIYLRSKTKNNEESKYEQIAMFMIIFYDFFSFKVTMNTKEYAGERERKSKF